MEEEAGIKEVINGHDEKIIKEEIFTKVVRAGKRTYFFDVKATRKDDYYLTITESKKRLGKEGKVFYEKHKIFLYKEDFEKFSEGLKDAVTYIGNGKDVSQVSEPVSFAETREEKTSDRPKNSQMSSLKISAKSEKYNLKCLIIYSLFWHNSYDHWDNRMSGSGFARTSFKFSRINIASPFKVRLILQLHLIILG